MSTFIGFPGNQVLNYPSSPNYPPGTGKNQTFRDYYRSQGWTTNDVLRADTRQEIDLPLHLGDTQCDAFQCHGPHHVLGSGFSGHPAGWWSQRWQHGALLGRCRPSRHLLQIWKVYEDVNSTFFDVHRLRHIIEPQFNMFYGVSNVDRGTLQPFDRDVEGITGSSHDAGRDQLQKWQDQTRRRRVTGAMSSWITFNIGWTQVYENKDDVQKGIFLPMLRGTRILFPVTSGAFYRRRVPSISTARGASVNTCDFQGEANYSLDAHRLSQYAWGLAIDQSPTLSYFLGNRYVTGIPSYDQGLLAPARTRCPFKAFLHSLPPTI